MEGENKRSGYSRGLKFPMFRKNEAKNVVTIMWVCAVLFFFFSGCATAPLLPEITVKAASQYRLSQDKEGLVIAVDPYLEKERLEEFFGFNLLSKGILPVLVVVENKSESSVYYLQKEQSSLSIAEDESAGKVVTSGNSLTYEVPGKLVKGAFYVSPILVASVSQVSENQRGVMNQIMVKNELRERTLDPGKTQYGFLFFKLTGKEKAKDLCAIKLKVLNTQNKENLLFSFPVK